VQRILRAASSTTETSFLLSDVFPSLPPQDEADRFFNLYLTSVHPIFPLLNIPIITASYTTLWTRDNIELSELLLLVSLLYSGHICTPGSYHDSLAALYNLLLSRSSFETSPTLPLLQAYVIYNSSDVSEALPLTSFTFLPSAVRSAQAMGLHTEPPNPLLPQQQEMRRRLWWHLVYLDVEASIASGLPRLIHPEDYDTPHPSSSDLSPSMGLALSARWEWTERMQRWLRRPPGSSETEAFSSRCEQLAGAATEPWARDYILLQPPRACCVLSHRIKSLRSSPPESALYASARSFLHLYLTLASSPTYHWFLPGLLHPLHATIILLLREELPSVEERGLLDRVFLSVGNTVVNGVLIPRAQGPKKDGTMWIYCLLGKLKGGVWRRAGWEMQGNERFCKLPSAEVEEEEREFDWEEWDRMVGIFFTAS